MKNHKYIICCFTIILSGLFALESEAAKKTVKITEQEALDKGKEAFLNYDFEAASDYFDQYKSLRTKAKKEPGEEFEELERKMEIAANAFDRVQKIVIIDSITLPRETFFNRYRLASSAGKIGGSKITDNPEVNSDAIVFMNEASDFIVWAQQDANDSIVLKEGHKLLDGEWINYEGLNGNFTKNGNYDYPFMSADGQTLYFANDGEGSMGGYDLFIAQRDPISGEYRQPLNMGMPFNSPYDDIMMAIDEEKGLGWWATDRNSPGGEVTVYIYLLDEIRENYPSDEEDLVIYARIDDWKATQNPDDENVYQAILDDIGSDVSPAQSQKRDFSLKMGSGKEYSRLKDFKNRQAAEQMNLYLKKEKELKQTEANLRNLRKNYAAKGKGDSSQIIRLEQSRDKLILELQQLKKDVYKYERSTR